MPELCRRYRRALQVAAQVFDAPPGATGLLREVDLPAAPVLRLQITLPLLSVVDMPQSRQAAGVNQVVTEAQQPDDRPAPDFLHGLLLKEEVAPDAVFYIEAAAGDGQVNVRMLVELAAVGVQGAEDADLHALPAGPAEHGAGGGAEQGVEERPVVVKKRPQQVGHGKGDVLPVAVGENVALLRHPLLGGFEAAGAAGLRLAALAEEAGVGTVCRCAAVASNAHAGGAAGELALNAEAGPGTDAVSVRSGVTETAVIDGEEQFCGAWNIHAAEYKTVLRTCKPSEPRSGDARPERALLFR